MITVHIERGFLTVADGWVEDNANGEQYCAYYKEDGLAALGHTPEMAMLNLTKLNNRAYENAMKRQSKLREQRRENAVNVATNETMQRHE